MTTKPAGSLPSAPSVTGADIVVIVKGGLFYRTTVDGLRAGMATATSEGKGLLSAADKVILDSLNTTVASLVAPTSTPIASAASIAIPAGRYHITLSGTTEVTSVTGAVPRVLYTVSYPSGAGVIFMGEPMKAGDVLPFIDV